jgi:aryl-alcohol dehydrogenase-like predicted oxidoreductase
MDGGPERGITSGESNGGRGGSRFHGLRPGGAHHEETSTGNPRFQGENFQVNLDLARKVKEFAGKRGCTPAQLALAWVLAKGDDMVPIPGTKHLRYLEENAASADIRLSREELSEIDRAFPMGAAAGTRYPEAMMGSVDA